MQHELHAGFTVDEPGSDEARPRFLTEQPEEAARMQRAEEQRRKKKSGKGKAGATLSLRFEDEAEDESETEP
jgi:hypothetical protein